MKLFSPALLALAALHQLAAAWNITSSDPVTPTIVPGANEPITKTWMVWGTDPLTQLQLQTIGRVFVEYDDSLAADGAAAKIVFSGNNTKLLNTFEVVNAGKNDAAIKVRFQNNDFDGQGYLLTQVFVASKQALTTVNSEWSADAILGEDVLAQSNASATIELSVGGSGDMYAGSDSAVWSVDSIALGLAGSGDIQVLANALEVKNSLAIGLAGSGDVAVVADKASAGTLASVLGGSGDITVQSGELTVHNLTTDIAGSGAVTYSKKGSCEEQSIKIAGAGDVAAGSIVCVNTDVKLVGTGDAVVQTTGDLTISSLFGGDVRYYGAEPSAVNVSGLFSFRGTHKKTSKVARATKVNNYNEYEVKDVPDRAALYIVVKIKPSFFSDEPSVRYELELDEYDEQVVDEFLQRQDSPSYQQLHVQTQALAVQTAHHMQGFGLLSIVGVGFVVVGVVADKYYKRRRDRHQYAPLV